VEQLLSTKLYIPPSRPKLVNRPRLIQQLSEDLQQVRGVTLISAPAGFGKTTLLSEWVHSLRWDSGNESKIAHPVAWLSLDEGDNDPARFLAYLVSALQGISPPLGERILAVLQAPQPPPTESILTSLLNEITSLPEDFLLILDDYHVIDAKTVDQALTFLLEHLPPQMHLVISTREDPPLPLARLRARDQLTELRAADLRFTHAEAAEFLNRVMGLKLSAEDIAALEIRTEGWIAGLQLAALSMQGQTDMTGFIQSFTGSHHFVMDYLLEEVLQRQPERIQTFLLHTSILHRLCGPLCDAVLLDPSGSGSGQETLEYLERANLFLIPLDNQRHWYRYHHLFTDLLRQRLSQSIASSAGDRESRLNELHLRASQWYEENGLDIEAFQHAAAANDLGRAARLVEEKGLPLHSTSAMAPVLKWLGALPAKVLESRPSLWVTHAALLLATGQTAGVEEKLQAAEVALAPLMQVTPLDEKIQFLIGQMAAVRSTLALTRYDVEGMLAQSERALEYLPPGHAVVRCTALWTMGFACYLLRDFARCKRAYLEAISISQEAGTLFTTILATIGLGNVQEAENQLHEAAGTYRRVLQMAGDQPQQIVHDAHLGLARLLYEWNDLDSAERHGEQALQLARQYESHIDRFVICEIFLTRLKLARGDVDGAASLLAKTEQSVRQQNFVYRIPEVADAQVLLLLRQGNVAGAAQLVQGLGLPVSQARVYLAQGDASAALAVLEPWLQQAESTGWENERLKTMALQAVVHRANGEIDKAIRMLGDALILAEPEGFIRTFVDEGLPMVSLLSEVAAHGIMTTYASKLLAAFEVEKQKMDAQSSLPSVQPLIEPLSQRELEVLQLIAQGLSNDEIGKRLFLALDTVKGHNRRIYDKLQVQRRTEAVARARELGLL
jgi:LuxR family transcriptional regulator, maltose regulon positive regulatory protein